MIKIFKQIIRMALLLTLAFGAVSCSKSPESMVRTCAEAFFSNDLDTIKENFQQNQAVSLIGIAGSELRKIAEKEMKIEKLTPISIEGQDKDIKHAFKIEAKGKDGESQKNTFFIIEEKGKLFCMLKK